MTNFYEILGVPSTADIQTIKAAFRQLAKQYHPDRNPNGKELFERVLLAYETLSDPAQKAAYDYRLNHQGSQQQQRSEAGPKPKGKNWRTDERELKRRQYYNEHIRKYAKETASYNAQAEEKKSYNEYKYILFATPLAVALFVMIMKLTGPVLPKKSRLPLNSQANLSGPELRPGDAPYNFLFGSSFYDTANGKSLVIKNMTGLDVIICVFTRTLFVRSFYIQSGFSAEVAQLPRTPIDIRYVCGQNFNYRAKLEQANVMSGFTRNASYYMSTSAFIPGNKPELSLQPGINEGFVQTTEKDFFKLPE